ncbi:MAG: response regulator [Proteobacteria bacterium]|nr:response regulator [Pseudomonadota bacterium]
MSVDLNTFFQNRSVLYAEDDVVSRTLYADHLSHYFNTLFIAENGQQAIELYREKKPDIVILDINMPLLSGLDVSKIIRRNDKQTKIILLTARNDKEALLKAIELGLTTYLEKPVKREQLEQALLKLSEQFDDKKKIKLWNFDNQYYFWCQSKQELFFQSDIITLTKKEKLLLELLIFSNHDKVNYQQIYDAVWFEDNNAKNFSEVSIKSIIKKLRTKLPPDVIKNVYGLGYYLAKPS